tara:strand:- start:26 stop:178 length:153 start_codon:yes stop_codon:yes gene_type:complete
MPMLKTIAQVVGVIMLKPVLAFMGIVVVFAIMAVIFWAVSIVVDILSAIF